MIINDHSVLKIIQGFLEYRSFPDTINIMRKVFCHDGLEGIFFFFGNKAINYIFILEIYILITNCAILLISCEQLSLNDVGHFNFILFVLIDNLVSIL